MKLVVGLGNPSPEYEKTRHNAGFRVIDGFSDYCGIRLSQRKHFSVFGKGKLGKEKIIIAKPLTYVNLSGRAVKSFMSYYRLDLQDLLLVYDDMDLETGRIRIRSGGSSGGHKGVESIMTHVGSEKFTRLRIGIGKEKMGAMTGREFVLRKFSRAEEPVIQKAVERSVSAIETIIISGITCAMNKFNGLDNEL